MFVIKRSCTVIKISHFTCLFLPSLCKTLHQSRPFITYQRSNETVFGGVHWSNNVDMEGRVQMARNVSLRRSNRICLTRDGLWEMCGILEKRERGTFQVYDLFRLPSKFLKLTGRIFISANGIECSWPFQWNQLMPCELK